MIHLQLQIMYNNKEYEATIYYSEIPLSLTYYMFIIYICCRISAHCHNSQNSIFKN